MKTLVFAAIFAFTFVCNTALANAGTRSEQIGWQVHQPTRFIVSGVLRQDGTVDVIKPIHGIVTADDSKAAVEAFTDTARTQYPGYTIIATLASPVPVVGTCENNI